MNFNSNTGGVLCQKVSHSFVPSAVLNKSSVITGADYRNNDQIVRLEETNKVQTNAIHQEEQNRKLVEMMSYLEQTFRGVILQLCRLLVLVHKTDPGASIPSDALGLMEWTHQMIEDKQLDVEPAEDSLETNPVNRISYIDVPPRFHSNPYATRYKETQSLCYLNKRNSQLNMSYLSNTS